MAEQYIDAKKEFEDISGGSTSPISYVVFTAYFRNQGCSDAVIEQAIQIADANKDGKITFAEYLKRNKAIRACLAQEPHPSLRNGGENIDKQIQQKKLDWRQELLDEAARVHAFPPQPLPQDQLELLLGGGASSITAAKGVVRIFTSSTFTDTEMERNFLMIDSYPFLRKLCRTLNLDFQIVDMRWGVRDERSDEHGTSSLCMSEVQKCLHESQSVAFVNILGDKYGFRPFPARIDAEEFSKLSQYLQSTSHPDFSLFHKWYKLDSNAIPPQYILQPIKSVLTHYREKNPDGTPHKENSEWWSTFEKIQAMLRTSAVSALPPLQAEKYIMSVTEEEVHNGILNNPSANSQCLFFNRVYTGIDFSDTKCGSFIDIKDKKEDTDATSHLAELKRKVTSKLDPQNIYKFEVDWKSRVTKIPDPKLQHFVDTFTQKIATRILESYKTNNFDRDEIVAEILHHYNTMKVKCASFIQRKGIHSQIEQYLHNENSTLPYIVHGESGSGKTSCMAQSAFLVKQNHPEAVVVIRFLGTSPHSSNARSMLYSVSCQINRAYGSNDEIPEDFGSLREFSILSLATEEKPLYVFLDSLDQMTNEDNALNMQWLPTSLPPNVHIMVSTLPDVGGCLAALKQRYPDEETYLKIPVLGTEDAVLILDGMLQLENRSLTATQREHIEPHLKACPIPLYTRLIADICAQLHSYDTVPTVAATVKGVIHDLLHKLERHHGDITVRHSLSYITCAKNGLTMSELEDLLALDDEVLDSVYQWWQPPERRMPPLLWLRIRSDLKGYLVERGSDNLIVYAWYHRQWIETVRERYLGTNNKAFLRLIHQNLANYFSGKWAKGKPCKLKNVIEEVVVDRLIDPQPLYHANGIPNTHKLSELPFHQLHGEQYQEMADLSLGYLPFISAKVEANKTFELIDDYLQLFSTPHPPEKVDELQKYYRFIKEKLHLLVKDTGALYQEALNSPSTEVIHREALEDIQTQKPNQLFINWMNRNPTYHPCSLTIAFPKINRADIIVSHDKKRLALINDDWLDLTIQILDLTTGATILSVEKDNRDPIWGQIILFSHDNSNILHFDNSASVFTYSIDTGNLIAQIDFSQYVPQEEFKEGKPLVFSACLSSDGKEIAIGLRTKTLLLHLDSSQFSGKLYNREIHREKRFPVSYFMQYLDSDVLIEGYEDKFSVWNIPTDRFCVCNVGDSFNIDLSSNKKYAATATSTAVSLWSIDSLEVLWKIDGTQVPCRGVCFMGTDVLFSNNGQVQSSPIQGKGDKVQILVEDIPDNDMLHLSHDEKNLIVLSDIRTTGQNTKPSARMWNLDLSPPKRIGRHTKFTNDGKQLLSIGRDMIKLLDLNLTETKPTNVSSTGARRIFVAPHSTLIAITRKDKDKIHCFEVYSLPHCTLSASSIIGKLLCFSLDGQKLCYHSHSFPNQLLITEGVECTTALAVPICGGSYFYPVQNVHTASFSNDQRYLAYATHVGVQIYDFKTNTSHSVLNTVNGEDFWKFKTIAFSQNTQHIVVAGQSRFDSISFVYNIQEKKIIFAHNKRFRWAIFSPKDPHVIIAGLQHGAEVQWLNLDGNLLHRFYLAEPSNSIDISPDGNYFVISDKHHHAYILTPYPHKPTKELDFVSVTDKFCTEKIVTKNMGISISEMLKKMSGYFECILNLEKKSLSLEQVYTSLAGIWKQQYQKKDTRIVEEVDIRTPISFSAKVDTETDVVIRAVIDEVIVLFTELYNKLGHETFYNELIFKDEETENIRKLVEKVTEMKSNFRHEQFDLVPIM